MLLRVSPLLCDFLLLGDTGILCTKCCRQFCFASACLAPFSAAPFSRGIEARLHPEAALFKVVLALTWHKKVTRGEPHAPDSGLGLDIWWKDVVCNNTWLDDHLVGHFL